MKRCICFFLLFALLPFSRITAVAASAEETLSLSAECAVLYDAENRRPLYGKNAEKRHPMASTTKIMTALVALEAMPLDTVITVPREATGVEGSSVYLKEGERYTLEALLYALLLQSANDAAEVIAYAVSGGILPFAEKMNERAAELGLTNTHFENPHGLDGDEHFTTATELAAIAAEALEHPDFFKIVSTRRYVFTSVDGENPRTLINHNKMLVLYDGAAGVKTGYTKKCGRCLVTAAKRDGLLLVSVTLDAPSDWSDHAKLLDYGFEHYESRLIAEAGALSLSLPLLNANAPATIVNRDEIRLVIPKGSSDPAPVFEVFPHPVAPIRAGEIAGTVSFSIDGGAAVSSPLVFSEDIPTKNQRKGWFGLGR